MTAQQICRYLTLNQRTQFVTAQFQCNELLIRATKCKAGNHVGSSEHRPSHTEVVFIIKQLGVTYPEDTFLKGIKLVYYC